MWCWWVESYLDSRSRTVARGGARGVIWPPTKWPNPTRSQDNPRVIIKGPKIWPIWPPPQRSLATGWDLPSQSWRKYRAQKDHCRRSHTGCVKSTNLLLLLVENAVMNQNVHAFAPEDTLITRCSTLCWSRGVCSSWPWRLYTRAGPSFLGNAFPKSWSIDLESQRLKQKVFHSEIPRY